MRISSQSTRSTEQETALRTIAAIALAALEPGYLHSPGYPQDDGEYELTDTGLTYRALAAALHDQVSYE
jgi:hypothetical protein